MSGVTGLSVSDLRLSCIEANGFRGNSPPEQSEGLHVADPLCNLGDGDVGVRAENFPV